MFDLAWSEIALIGVVALIAIGPKDLPIAIKAVAEAMKKARRMASEFQTHVDDMVRDADLKEVRDQFNEIRNLDIKGKILGAVDGDGSIRRTMSDTTFSAPPPPVTPVVDTPVLDTPVAEIPPHAIEAPSFIPPDAATDPAPGMTAPAYVDPRRPPPAAPPQHEPATPSAPHA